METLTESAIGSVLFAIVFVLAFCWLFLPFLLLSKMSQVLKEQREQVKILRQVHAELIESNQWAAVRVGFTDELPKRFQHRTPA